MYLSALHDPETLFFSNFLNNELLNVLHKFLKYQNFKENKNTGSSVRIF